MAKTLKIAPDVAAVLQQSIVNGATLQLPAGQLDRALYTAVDKVLKALGGKWNRGAGVHVFRAGLPADLAEVLAAGEVVDRKKTLEFFETPPELAKCMADAAAAVSDRLPRNIRVLEPSAGHGRLLTAFAEHLDTNGKDTVLAIEIDADNCAALRAQGIATAVECDDFLAAATVPRRPFDVILMNPPFSRNQDIAHVTAALKLLAEDGVLVAITSRHWRFSDDAASRVFRALMERVGADVEEIEAGAFRAEGTNIATVMITVRNHLSGDPA